MRIVVAAGVPFRGGLAAVVLLMLACTDSTAVPYVPRDQPAEDVQPAEDAGAPASGSDPGQIQTGSACDSTIVFSDDELLDANWTVDVSTVGAGGTVDAQHVATGGSPGGYRRITNRVFGRGAEEFASVIGAHLHASAVYEPATQGGIRAVVYSQTGKMFEGFGQGQAHRILLKQDGVLFHNETDILSNSSDWSEERTSELQSTDLVAIDESGRHPNFENGPPIRFGFLSSNLTRSDEGYTIIGGIDNWRVEVIPVICQEDP